MRIRTVFKKRNKQIRIRSPKTGVTDGLKVIMLLVISLLLFGWVMSFVHYGLRNLVLIHQPGTEDTEDSLKRLALKITENTSEDIEKVDLLADWISKKLSEGSGEPMRPNPHPLHIISKADQGFIGSCGENAKLLETLASSIGFEARIVGLSEYSHVITEVHVDGKWVMFDPMMLGSKSGPKHYEKGGVPLNTAELYSNQDLLTDDVTFGEEFLSTYRVNTKNQYIFKDKISAPYYYGKEWPIVDSSIASNGIENGKNTRFTSYTVFPLFYRIGIFINNVPIIFHFELILTAIWLLVTWQFFKKREHLLKSYKYYMVVSIGYLAVETALWANFIY